jgi:para-aminobenzoate synthetase/4-amino-4-deoxychorismate lyase
MEIICELEEAPRRLYTGCIGFMAPNRNAQFNVAIRTVLLNSKDKSAEYGVGGGIVWDSDEKAEWGECRSKTLILCRNVPDFSLRETILWTQEAGFFLLNRHIKRLRESAEYFEYPFSEHLLLKKLERLAGSLAPFPYKIRVILSSDGSTVLENHPLKPANPIAIISLARNPIHSRNRFLYHKTTMRAPYDQALKNCPGFEDVLLWNEKGEITESCIANVVVNIGGELLTPPLECGLLAGTYRSWLVEQGEIREETIRVEDLHSCNAVFLINSVRKKWKVEVVGLENFATSLTNRF